MKCKEIHPLMMDFIYDEISEDNNLVLQSHLTKCEKCRAEIESLKGTSRILQQWEDSEPNFNLTLVSEKISWTENFKERIINIFPKAKKYGFGFAYGFVAVFLLLAISNTEISYQQGNFKMHMGLFSKKAQQNQTELLAQQTQQVIEKLRQDNYYLTKTLIEQSEARQRQEWTTTLAEFNQSLEQKRLQDLNLIGSGLVNFEKHTNTKLQKTDNSLNELLRQISLQK